MYARSARTHPGIMNACDTYLLVLLSSCLHPMFDSVTLCVHNCIPLRHQVTLTKTTTVRAVCVVEGDVRSIVHNATFVSV
jgi:hypothetical protein